MQTVQTLYPRFLVFSGVIIAFLLVLALLPGTSDATTMTNPVMTTASETSRKLGPGDCKLDQYAHSPTCQVGERQIRVINF